MNLLSEMLSIYSRIQCLKSLFWFYFLLCRIEIISTGKQA